jgi:acetyl esterase/lipase
MRSLPAVLYLLVASTLCAAPLDPLPLWPGAAPGALGTSDKDIPTLTPFLPAAEKASGTAIVVCPGGGYGGLAAHEGPGYAEWLAQHGIAAFVLKYRLGSAGYRHPIMLGDAQRAIRLVRSRAAEWKIDPQRVGIMGSSAGGHLASTAVTHFDSGKADAGDPIDRQNARPDFGILCYPVITLGEFTHAGSKKNLLGENPDPALVELLSNEKQVTKDTPPCFVWSTMEDKAVPVENSMQFVVALRKAGVPFDFHVYERGPHGIGLSSGKHGIPADDVHPWAKDLLFWLKQNGWLR